MKDSEILEWLKENVSYPTIAPESAYEKCPENFGEFEETYWPDGFYTFPPNPHFWLELVRG